MKKILTFLFGLNERKKIIAREFLLFISLAIIGAIVILISFLKVEYYQSRIESQKLVENTLQYPLERARLVIETKERNQKWLIDQLSGKYMPSTWDELKTLTKPNKVGYPIWNSPPYTADFISYVESFGYNPKNFSDFISSRTITEAELTGKNKLESQMVRCKEDIEWCAWEIDYEKENRYFDMMNVLIIGAIILFGLRYIIYAILWSIKILKS